MSLRADVFALLDSGVLSPTEIAKRLDADLKSVQIYKTQWKKERGIDQGPAKDSDELYDRIFNTKEEKLKEAATKLTNVAKDNKEEKPIVKKTFVPNSEPKKEIKSSLKLVTESKTYEGKYATYVVTDGIAEIKLKDNPTSVDKPVLAELVEELNELGGLM